MRKTATKRILGPPETSRWFVSGSGKADGDNWHTLLYTSQIELNQFSQHIVRFFFLFLHPPVLILFAHPVVLWIIFITFN